MDAHKNGLLINCASTADTLFLWSDTPVSSFHVTWTPKKDEDKAVDFVAAVFETEEKYWTNITSGPLQIGFETIDISTCGKSKGCFRYSSKIEDCTAKTCDYLFTYRILEDGETVQFELSAEADWVAIGFSSDKLMGGDDVLMCEQTVGQGGGGAHINHYLNNRNYATPTKKDNPTTERQTEIVDGRLSCRFHRKLTVIRSMDSVDLNNDWYHLYAWGPKSAFGSGALRRHTIQSPPTSDTKISLVARTINVQSAATRQVTSSTNYIALIVIFLYLSFWKLTVV